MSMHISEFIVFKDAIASTALSHPKDCDCRTCRAAAGDPQAFNELLVEYVESKR